MTPTQAGALMRRARKLLRTGLLTHHDFVLLDCMAWSCRAPGADRLAASYSRLTKLAHMARATVAKGLRRLEAAGLIRRVKRRVRVMWASRQATSVYVLLAPATEFTPRPVLREQGRKQAAPEVEAALARLARAAGLSVLPSGNQPVRFAV